LSAAHLARHPVQAQRRAIRSIRLPDAESRRGGEEFALECVVRRPHSIQWAEGGTGALSDELEQRHPLSRDACRKHEARRRDADAAARQEKRRRKAGPKRRGVDGRSIHALVFPEWKSIVEAITP
jgi:hypothetical protein